MRLSYIFIVVFATCSFVAEAQFTRTIHESIAADSADIISLDLSGDIVADTWAGNTVLVETDIRMFNTTEGAFEFFIDEDKRYAVASALANKQLKIYSEKPQRKPIQTREGIATEEVMVKVLIPNRFVGEGTSRFNRVWVRPASLSLLPETAVVGVSKEVDAFTMPPTSFLDNILPPAPVSADRISTPKASDSPTLNTQVGQLPDDAQQQTEIIPVTVLERDSTSQQPPVNELPD